MITDWLVQRLRHQIQIILYLNRVCIFKVESLKSKVQDNKLEKHVLVGIQCDVFARLDYMRFSINLLLLVQIYQLSIFHEPSCYSSFYYAI